MCEDLSWCCLPFSDFEWLMIPVVWRCRLNDAFRPILILPNYCAHAMADVSWLGWSIVLLDVTLPMRRPRPMLPSWCTHAITDSYRSWMLFRLIGKCFLADVHQLILHVRCAQTANDVALLMSTLHCWYVHALSDDAFWWTTLFGSSAHQTSCMQALVHVHFIFQLHLQDTYISRACVMALAKGVCHWLT